MRLEAARRAEPTSTTLAAHMSFGGSYAAFGLFRLVCFSLASLKRFPGHPLNGSWALRNVLEPFIAHSHPNLMIQFEGGNFYMRNQSFSGVGLWKWLGIRDMISSGSCKHQHVVFVYIWFAHYVRTWEVAHRFSRNHQSTTFKTSTGPWWGPEMWTYFWEVLFWTNTHGLTSILDKLFKHCIERWYQDKKDDLFGQYDIMTWYQYHCGITWFS